MLPRDTIWRQGNILTQDSSYALDLYEKTMPEKRTIIISHDCDLPNENEEHVEVIVASIVAKTEPNYSHAKNSRRLHITYNNTQSLCPVFMELHHSERVTIRKTLFAHEAKPDLDIILPYEQKCVLKQWLAARYGRPAFPNVFEDRLRKGKKFEQKLADQLKPYETYLIGIFFDLGEERSVDLPLGSPYSLRISVVYKGIDGVIARTEAEACAEKISAMFHKEFGTPNIATELALESCQAVADINFSIADLRKVDQWRVDYISLRNNPPGTFLATGETPA